MDEIQRVLWIALWMDTIIKEKELLHRIYVRSAILQRSETYCVNENDIAIQWRT